jgi:hypothetical protein
MSEVADTMAAAYVSTAARLKAGLDRRLCRCHTSPSLTSRPFPAMHGEELTISHQLN